MKDFEFYVGGIEDAILQTLEQTLKPLGVKTFDTYSGELDSENLKGALGALAPNFPLILVSYTDGKDTADPVVAPVGNRSLHFRHDCSFSVICVSGDARGDKSRRRGKVGVYAMLAQVREILGGLRFKAEFENENAEIEQILLTTQPLKPSGVEYIARIPNCTAYATFFDTYFRFSTAERRSEERAVVTLDMTLDTKIDSETNLENPTGNVPGVIKRSR